MNRSLSSCAAALLVAALAAGCSNMPWRERSSPAVAGSGTSDAACDIQAAQTAAGAMDNAAAPMYGCGVALPR